MIAPKSERSLPAKDRICVLATARSIEDANRTAFGASIKERVTITAILAPTSLRTASRAELLHTEILAHIGRGDSDHGISKRKSNDDHTKRNYDRM